MDKISREFYEQNEAFISDIREYYSKMEEELNAIFSEILPEGKVTHNLYAVVIPFKADVCGLLIGKECPKGFRCEEVKIAFGKRVYDTEPNSMYDIMPPIEDDYLQRYEQYGSKLPRFPYVQRYGTIPDYLNTEDIAGVIEKSVESCGVRFSQETIISKWITFGEMMVFFVTELCSREYQRYKTEIEAVDKEDLDYKYFLDTVVRNFQERWCEHIYFGLTYSTIEFLSGTQAVIQGSANDILQERGLPEVNLITRLSNTEYEGEFSSGTIRFYKDIDEEDEETVLLNKPIPFEASSIREIRKLLQISEGNICLEASKDRNCIVGIGNTNQDNKEYRIVFNGKNSWELRRGNTAIIRFVKGQYRVPLDIKREDVVEKLRDNFGEEFDETVADIIISAMDQTHGTIVVVSTDAAKNAGEAIREGKGRGLQNSNHIKLSGNMVRQLCAIDGALMIDPYGKCEGIGIILPNEGNEKGDPSRGARYNSSKAYAEAHKDSLVCVISEDGMIDFLGKGIA